MALFGGSKDANDQPMAKQTGSPAPGQVNLIGQGTVIDGVLRSEGSISISGRVIGEVHAQGKVTIEKVGTVEGEVEADSADIGGQVKGDLVIKDRLLLRTTARVEGNIKTERLIMEEGAVFDGHCDMGPVAKKTSSGSGPKVVKTQQDGKNS